jgi:hypothetical protein
MLFFCSVFLFFHKRRVGMARKVSQSRRSFLKKGGVVAAAGAVGLGASSKAEVAKTTLNQNRMEQLRSSAKAAKEFAASTRQVARSMTQDPAFAIKLLQNVDSVQLLNHFNANRTELEAIVGRVDGRTTEGRYVKILTASELLSGANNLDGMELATASEDLGAFGAATPADSVSCSGCDAMGASFLGCCIIHFWGWSSTGSCTPCT